MTVPNRIIVALDYESEAQAAKLVQQLGDKANFYKVGLQLLTAAGPKFVRELVATNKRVFLDLKSFEIPNSVAGAVDAAGALGVSMVTVHAGAGSKALEAAVEAARSYPHLSVIALTVVTSMADADLHEVGINSTVQEQVLRLAKLAVNTGCDGIVAAASELALLRQEIPQEMTIVTPGIQLDAVKSNGQIGVSKLKHAIDCGANYLVIGRAITQAPDPLSVFTQASLELF